MRKIITFLGMRPILTDYKFNDTIYSGHVFAEALRQFAHYDRMFVFVTEQAKEASWPVLEALNDDRIQPVSIPLGRTNAEMWLIFEKILDRVDEGDSIIFDITHGLRSTPFLVFLFAAFLKFARNVKIEAVYYGGYELGNKEENIPAPVFDLSEFVDMLDWLTAADRFITTGDGEALAELLKDEMPPGHQMGKNLDMQRLGNNLKGAADSIEVISQALRMVHPVEVMQAASKISNAFERSKESVEKTAKPFEAIAEKIEKAYGSFALEGSLKPEQAQRSLEQQLEMIGWYLARQQAAQAILLMREWLVSVLMFLSKNLPYDSRKRREDIENILNNAATCLRDLGSKGIKHFDSTLDAFSNPLVAIQYWQQITELRNDLAHCGMRQNAKKSDVLIDKAGKMYKKLCHLAKEMGLDPD